MAMVRVVLFVVSLALTLTNALPLANVHVKFISPPDVYEHGVTTDGDRTIARKTFISIGRRNGRSKNFGEFGQRINSAPAEISRSLRRNFFSDKEGSPESLWPVGVFLPPMDLDDLGYSLHDVERFTVGFRSDSGGYEDPLLLTGREAALAVEYLYGHGELFYDDFPHARALLLNQEERKRNGLHGNVLSSSRPNSPFYRKGRH